MLSFLLGSSALATVFSNSAAITIPATGSGSPAPGAPASAYPSTIAVSGMVGTVSKITVTITGFSHSTSQDVDMLLVGPTGTNIMMWSDIAGSSGSINVTLDDAAATQLTNNALAAGTFRPNNNAGTNNGGNNDNFPGPAPAISANTTFAAAFNGINPNGNWQLYIIDDANGDVGSISGGWSIDVTTGVAAAPTTTALTTSHTDYAVTGNNVTFTATVTKNSDSSAVTAGTVTFKDNGSALSGAVALNGSGVATFSTTSLTAGNHSITAEYSGTASFVASTGSLVQVVDGPTTVAGNVFTNAASIAIPQSNLVLVDNAVASPYASHIAVSGVTGSISKVTVTLTNLSHAAPDDIDMLLVSPAGTTRNIILMADSGGGAAVGPVTLTFDDAAAAGLPDTGGLSTGTFLPTNNAGADSFPAPAPAVAGNTTLGAAFNGTDPNGVWRLYIVDDAGGELGQIAGGWKLTFTTSGDAPTSTTVTSSQPDYALTGSPVTLTATVRKTSDNNLVTTGTVTFKEGSTVLSGPTALNASGQAAFTTSTLPLGSHTITAEYSGVPGNFNLSTGTFVQNVDNATTMAGATWSNTGTIPIPGSGAIVNGSPASPYPSHITVAGAGGTVATVTVTLNGLTHTSPDDIDVLLVSPAGGTHNLILMSDNGGATDISNVNLTFADTAAGSLPDSAQLTTGSYKPTNSSSSDSDTFLPPAPATSANTTLAGAFNSTDPNGTWTLYIMDDAGADTGSITGWSITLGTSPAFTSANNATFTVGTMGNFTVAAGGQPAPTLSHTGGTLPTGVTFNPANGSLSGTPAAGTGGTYNLQFTATNGNAPNATQNFTLTVNQPPAITSANATTFTVGTAGSFTVTTTGFPTSALSRGGVALPSGVTFTDNGNGTGTLAGTPGANTGGTYAISFTANNGVAPNATQNFTLSVNQPPAITSANAATFTVGTAGSFTVTTGNKFPTATTLGKTGALPTGVTFTDNGNGTATLAGTPAAATGGIYPLTITASNGITPDGTQSFTLTVNQAPAITSANATTFTIGTPGSFTVTTSGFPTSALNRSGALPTGVTFTDNGNGTGTLAGTPAAATNGDYAVTFTANNGVAPNATQSFTLTVKVAVTHFSVTGAPANVAAGTPFNVTVTALDSANATVTAYTGMVHFTSTDGQAVLPADSTLTNGTGTFAVTLKTTGSQTVSVNDTATVTITGTSSAVNVTPLAVTKFGVVTPPNATAGTPFSFTVTAQDQFSNTVPGYLGTVQFTKSDSGAGSAVPANYTFVGGDNGTHTFTNGATLVTAGNRTITATDTVTPAITGTSANVLVSATSVTKLAVSAPANATAGTPFSFTVTAQDQFSNTVPGYLGTVQFTKTDSGAGSAVPVNYTFLAGDNGTHTFTNGATLVTAGNQTITATDTVTPAITGTSNGIAVSAAAATHFAVTAPANATAGTGFSFTVTARDQFDNTATAYAGTAHFTSTDGAATLPADALLTNGAGTFSATLKTAGNQTITATDTVTPAIAGTSNSVAVSAAAATHFAVSAPASATAGSAFSFTVTAQDQFNNTATGYTGTAQFLSTDGAAVLPASSTLLNGTGTFSATLKTAGVRTITATDTVTPAITGTSNNIAVSAAAATHFAVTAPASATAGTGFSFTVTARDQFDNTATAYAGTAHFTSTDGAAVLSADSTLTNGAGTFSATLKTAGNQTITATDTVTPAITGTSNSVAVSAAAATHFAVSTPANATAGSAFSFTVTAQDQFSNTDTSYAGTAHFTSTDGAAVLPADSTLTNGVGTFSATLKTAGAQTITATDTVTPAITGTSSGVVVGAATATHFAVSAPASATAGSAFSFTVTAQDQFNNTATGYTGTVHATSTDAAAVLPPDSTLTNGIGTFSATLKTAGSQTITATDTVTPAITGTSNSVAVSAAAATKFAVSAPATAKMGIAFNFTVTARDQFDNTATAYAGTVHFTSTDGAAVLPADSTLASGAGTFSATLNTLGNQTLTATDTVSGSVTGTSANISVVPPNDPPVAVDDTAFVKKDAPVDIDVLANDTDPDMDTLKVTAVTQGQHGTVTIVNAGAKVNYAPTGKFQPDTFTYTIDDGAGGTDTATVTVGDLLSSEAGAYAGLVQGAAGTTPDNQKAGTVRVTINRTTGKFTGTLKLAAKQFPLGGTFEATGAAKFGAKGDPELVLKRKDLPDLKLTLRLVLEDPIHRLTGELTEGGAPFATILAGRAFYTSRKNPVPPLMNVPPGLLGKYTVIFSAKTPAVQGQPASAFPQGDGVGLITVSTNGNARLTGTLADGTPVSCSASLWKSNVMPFYAPIAASKGSISAPLFFEDTPNVSDLDGLNALWFKPASNNAVRYPAGWPNGIKVDILGSKFVAPPPSANKSIMPLLTDVDADGNANVALTDGNLTLPLTIAVNISTRDKVEVVTPGADKLTMNLRAPLVRDDKFYYVPTGIFTGSFIHTTSGKRTILRGAVFQKQKMSFGFFLGPTESGALTLTPK